MTTETTTPNQENIRIIREALHIGLECFGEVERLIDLCKSPRAQSGGIPKDYRPLHPTGTADTVCRFAYALRALEQME